MGTADVIVTDGFTGNVMLKTMEGVGKFLLKSLKEMFLSSTKTKLAAGLVKGDLGQMKKAARIPARWAAHPSWGSKSR